MAFHRVLGLNFAIILSFGLTAAVAAAAESRSLHGIASNMVSQDLQKRDPVVIGVITQVLRDYKRFVNNRHFHLPSSYVKWIESSGAQVLPILLNQEDSYYQAVFKQTNGLLFPGGDNLLDPNKSTPMMEAAKRLYRLAVDANDRGDFYPIWGTCLGKFSTCYKAAGVEAVAKSRSHDSETGLELLSVLTANRNVLVECSANDIAAKMEFRMRGRIFSKGQSDALNLTSDLGGRMMEKFESDNLCYHYHHKCLTDDVMRASKLDTFYQPLSYSYDKQGKRFISIMEAIDYPFFAVQFHPEKPPFEFVIKRSQSNIPHSAASKAGSRYLADFFVEQARKNRHRTNNQTDQLLIYKYRPTYTGLLNDMYEQRYLFPFSNDVNHTSEEFLEYVPNDDEEAPEDISD